MKIGIEQQELSRFKKHVVLEQIVVLYKRLIVT